MPRTLTIRNLTTVSLSLTLVESFARGGDHRSGTDGRAKHLASNFSSVLKAAVPGRSGRKKSETSIPDDAEPIKQDQVIVWLEPFRTKTTQILVLPVQLLRLSIVAEGGQGKWKVDVPSSSGKSTTLTALSDDLDDEFTAIYNEDTAVLALFDSSDLSSWMHDFPDSAPLSALSIPGTHNSPTWHPALPSVRCQARSPLKQLENGVRFFDVRVQVNDPEKGANSDNLELVHAAFPISLTGSVKARTLFDDMYAFLDKNPSETIIMSLKREGRGSGTDSIFADRLQKQYIAPNQQRWHTHSGIPTLGEVRGKIILLRRFGLSDALHQQVHGKGGFGIDATNWADNTANHLGGNLQIQDFYEVTDTQNIEKKIQYVCAHYERAGTAVHPIGASQSAAEGPQQPLFLNFLSASNFWKSGCWPDKIAAKMNPAITQFLCENHDIGDRGVDAPDQKVKGDGGLGVVVCDWVGKNDDWDLVRAIVGMNSRLLLRLQKQHVGVYVDGAKEAHHGGGRRGGRNGRWRGRGRGGIRGQGGRTAQD